MASDEAAIERNGVIRGPAVFFCYKAVTMMIPLILVQTYAQGYSKYKCKKLTLF